MRKKILIILVICLGFLALAQSVQSGDTGELRLRFYTNSTPDVVIANWSDQGWPSAHGTTLQLTNVTTQQARYIIALGSFIYNTSEITKLELNIYINTVVDDGNVSAYKLTGDNAKLMKAWEANWTSGRDAVSWTNEGGDYNQTPINTLYINTTGNKSFDITYYLNDTETSQYGIILIAELNANFTIFGSAYRPSIKAYYNPNVGHTTTITKDIWNLEGFSGGTPKLASTIYSEISYCTALSWKNATSGYWYTYWPSLGLTEDEYLNFGDGLFILTTQNTTWDHT